MLQGAGVITENDASSVIDKNKIYTARNKRRKNSVALNKTALHQQSLYFDGRKDQTITQKLINGRMHNRTVVEEHQTLIKEPQSEYIGHFAASAGSSQSLFNGIIDYCDSNKLSLDDVAAIGCDGTAVNTGRNGGVIKRLEDHLNKSLQLLVCLLLTNELPLRHLMKELDGGTSGPEDFRGLIGKQLIGCELLDIVDFEAVQVPEITIDEKDLSSHQKYLLGIFNAVRMGFVSPHPFSQKTRTSKPLTLADNCMPDTWALRFYLPTIFAQIDLVQYMMSVYVPDWFQKKSNSNLTNGARHFYTPLNCSQSMTQRVQDVVNRVLQRNGVFFRAPG